MLPFRIGPGRILVMADHCRPGPEPVDILVSWEAAAATPAWSPCLQLWDLALAFWGCFFSRSCAQGQSDTMSVKEISIGMFGAGTVGGGAIEIIRRWETGVWDRWLGARWPRSRCCRKKDLFASLGFSLNVKKICVRDASKKRDFELPAGCAIVTDPKEILDDDSIQARFRSEIEHPCRAFA